MQVKPTELAMMMFSLRTKETPQGPQPRQFSIDQLKMAMELYDRLISCSEGEGEQKKFIDGEIELSKDEKTFIAGLVKRSWSVDEGKVYFELEKKLTT